MKSTTLAIALLACFSQAVYGWSGVRILPPVSAREKKLADCSGPQQCTNSARWVYPNGACNTQDGSRLQPCAQVSVSCSVCT
ncbi:hypothetical protein EJ03DRAFT_325232 [Teratosphaeria nubilosa]|uniref:CBM1 domain-containing protein n=1 Tax=Teratosphaeria nubilosa TaxID=161662 RepID=A0A6G1LHF2_9PEZI|nr:hypothetical protein EJ03DRAFT_325232 [Teratosphaeria nubilosa]